MYNLIELVNPILKKKGLVMKIKLLISLLLSILVIAGNWKTPTLCFAKNAIEEIGVPQYAKWGRLAMQKTKEKYPEADIIDYLHIGTVQGKTSTTEKFKLWLKRHGKEFGVFVHIEYDKDSEQIIKIDFKEIT
jgi:hypothetical protein